MIDGMSIIREKRSMPRRGKQTPFQPIESRLILSFNKLRTKRGRSVTDRRCGDKDSNSRKAQSKGKAPAMKKSPQEKMFESSFIPNEMRSPASVRDSPWRRSPLAISMSPNEVAMTRMIKIGFHCAEPPGPRFSPTSPNVNLLLRP